MRIQHAHASSPVLECQVLQLFALFVFSLAAAESAIGLASLVIYYRVRGTVAVQLIPYQRERPFLKCANPILMYTVIGKQLAASVFVLSFWSLPRGCSFTLRFLATRQGTGTLVRQLQVPCHEHQGLWLAPCR